MLTLYGFLFNSSAVRCISSYILKPTIQHDDKVILNCHAKQTINTLLTEHGEIHFGVSGWRLFEVHPTPVQSAVGFADALHCQLGRIVRIPEECSSTQNLLIWPVLRLVERFPTRVETATWHKSQWFYRSCVNVPSRDAFSTVLLVLVLFYPNSQGVHKKEDLHSEGDKTETLHYIATLALSMGYTEQKYCIIYFRNVYV
jgi:hypothetical protein